MDETHPCPRKACSLMQEADASTITLTIPLPQRDGVTFLAWGKPKWGKIHIT